MTYIFQSVEKRTCGANIQSAPNSQPRCTPTPPTVFAVFAVFGTVSCIYKAKAQNEPHLDKMLIIKV